MKKILFEALALTTLSIALSSCGGGGSSSTADPVVPSTPATMAATAIDLVSLQQPSGGVVPDGAAIDIEAVYTGPASVGELVKITANFARNTYSWQVLQSSFDISGQAGSGTLSKAASGGGYTMSNGGKLFLTQAGSIQINGLPLTIGGTTTQVALSAQPVISTPLEVKNMAGDYVFSLFRHSTEVNPPYDESNAQVGWGTAKINSDGTGHLCPTASVYSDNCVDSETNTQIKLTVVAHDAKCSEITNLFGVYFTQTSQIPDFAGCAVLSSNGSGNVVYMDKQASSNGSIQPGFMTMVQLPKSDQTFTVQAGTYTETAIVDLTTGPTDDTCIPPFTFSSGSMSAQCIDEGISNTETFSVSSQAPLPVGVLGIIDDSVSSILLPLSPDTWQVVEPTGSIYGADTTMPGFIGTIQRTGI